MDREQSNTPLEQLKQHSAKEEQEFRKLIPVTGFFGEYMKYTDHQESPGSFHFWVAASVLSAVLQRRAWVSKGVYNVYPNIFMILVAPSGTCRKSRALNLGTDLIHDFDFVNIVADKTTPEALLEALMVGSDNLNKTDTDEQGRQVINLQVDSTGFIKAGELSVFLNKQTYTSGMVNLLTDLYDCPQSFKYQTRNKKLVKLRNVAVTFVGASTPDWLATSLPEAAFEGGFMSRILFVVKYYKDRSIALPMDPPKGMVESLQRRLMEIRKLHRGRIELTQGARNWYLDWYDNLEYTPLEDESLRGFLERKPDLVLKMGLLLSASYSPVDKLISKDHLIQANEIISWTQARMFHAFKEVDLTHIGRLIHKVRDILEQYGAVTRRNIMRKLGSRINGVNELEEVEKIMEESGELMVEHIVPEKGGKTSIVYRRPNNE